MNREVKARWLADLRSGNFAQTRGTLRQIEAVADRPCGDCCLGVLMEGLRTVYPNHLKWDTGNDGACVLVGVRNDYDEYYDEVIDRDSWIVDDASGELEEFGNLLFIGLNETVRTPPFYEEAKAITWESIANVLMYLNDDLKWTFDQIADFAEEFVPEDDEPITWNEDNTIANLL